jgi:hypothetical protein
MVNYYQILDNKIKTIITNDLTIGRTDRDLMPLTSEEINKFITENRSGIDKTINTMIAAYDEDNELELLENPELSWIIEFLYDEVNIY